MLDREEYVEQAHFFRTLAERVGTGVPMQELLRLTREEILATTKLPLAIDFLAGELNLRGAFATAMIRLPHYFTAFQTFVVAEAENDRGHFDLRTALEILRREAEYKADGASPQGLFLFRLEALCRNRLGYDRGLEAVADDPLFDDAWRSWLDMVRRQIGIIDIADLIYVRSQFYVQQQLKRGEQPDAARPPLFGEKEGRIALANQKKDPLFLFAALQRQLGYPVVPRPARVEQSASMLPQLARQVQRLEARLKLLEEEQRQGGIDLSQFYAGPDKPP